MRSKLASSIAILLNYGAKWRALYYIFYVLCLDYTLSIVLDSKVFLNGIKSYARKSSNPYEGTLLDNTGMLVTYFGKTNIFRYIQNSEITTVYIIAILYLAVFGLALLLIYFHWPSRKFLESRWMGSILIWMLNSFDYFLLIAFDVFFQSITCVKQIVLTEGSALNDKYYVPERVVGTNFFEFSFQSSSLNTNLLCGSIDHIFISVLASVSLAVTIALKIACYGRLALFPDPRVSSKRNFGGQLLNFGMMLLLLMRYFLVKNEGNISKLYYSAAVAIFGACAVAQIILKPFYRESENVCRLFGIMILTIVSIFVLEATTSMPEGFVNRSVRLIGVLLALPVLIKAINQVSKRTMRKTKMARSLDQSALDNLYLLYHAVMDYQLGGHHGTDANLRSMMKVVFDYALNCKDTVANLNNPLLQYLNARDSTSTLMMEDINEQVLAQLELLLEDAIYLRESRGVEIPTPLLLGHLVFLELYRKKTSKAICLLRTSDSAANRLLTDVNNPTQAPDTTMEDLAGRTKGAGSLTSLLEGDKLEHTKKSFTTRLMTDFLSYRLRENIRLKQLDVIGSTNNNLTKIDFDRSIKYFNGLALLTNHIAKLLLLRTRLISHLANSSLDGKTLFSISDSYDRLESLSQLQINSLQFLVENKSTALQLIEAFFTRHFKQDGIEAVKVLRASFKQHFVESFMTDYVDDQAIPNSVCMIGVSLETSSFNLINLVSSSAVKVLGYKNLMGNDLSVLLPSCIANNHRNWIHPRNIKGTLVNNGSQLKVWANDSSGVLQKVETSVRMNPMLASGLQAIGALATQKDTKDWLVVLDIETGVVADTSIRCQYFKKTFSLFDYQPHLKGPLESYYHVIKSQISKDQANGFNMLSTLARSEEPKVEFDQLQDYIRLCQGFDTFLEGKNRTSPRFKLFASHLEDWLIDPKHLVLTFIQSEPTDADLLSPQEFFLRIEPSNGFHANQDEENESKTAIDANNGRISRLQTMKSNGTLQKQSSMQGVMSLSNMIAMSLQKLSAKNPEEGASGFGQLLHDFAKLKASPNKPHGNHHRKKLDSDSTEELDSSQSDHDRHKSRTYVPSMNHQRVAGSTTVDAGSVSSRTSINPARKMRNLVFQKRQNVRYSLVFSILGLTFFVAQIIVGAYKHAIQFKVYKELNFQTVNLDYGTWNIWGEVVFVLAIDTARQVYDEIVPNDYYKEWGIPDLLNTTNQRKAGHKGVVTQYSLTLTNALVNSTFPHLSQLKIPGDPITMWNFKQSLDGTVTWSSEVYNPIEAVKMVQKSIDSFILRNDSTWSGRNFSIGQDRDKDPEAEYLRRNLLGGLLSYSYGLFELMCKYVEDVAEEYRYTLIMNQIVNLAFVNGILLLLMIVFFVKIHFMKKTTKAAFMFKLAALENALNVQRTVNIQFEGLCSKPYETFQQISRSGKLASDFINFELDSTNDSRQPGKKSRALHKDRTKVKPGDFNFGFFKRLLVLACLYVLSMLLELPFFLENLNEAKVVINQVKLFTLIADLWNTHYMTWQSLDSLIMWGRDLTYMDATPEEISFRLLNHYQTSVIARFDGMRSADLGEVTEFYRNMTGPIKVCDFLKTGLPLQYGNCGEGLSNVWDKDFITALKTMTAQINQFREDAIRNLGSASERHGIYSQPMNRLHRAYYLANKNVISEIYYKILFFLSQEFEGITNRESMLTNNTNIEITFYLKLFGSAVFLLSICVVVFFARPVSKIFRVFSRYLQLLPFELSVTNLALMTMISRKHSN